MKVFFYGLFMDESLLAARGIELCGTNIGFVDGFRLCIGERATLARHRGCRVYGVMMDIAASDVSKLYGEKSVEDYLPERVTVELMNGAKVEATCYVLPGDKLTGVNRKYAESLLDIAIRLDFPDDYLDEIRRALT